MDVFAEVKGAVRPCQNKTDSKIVCKPTEVINE